MNAKITLAAALLALAAATPVHAAPVLAGGPAWAEEAPVVEAGFRGGFKKFGHRRGFGRKFGVRKFGHRGVERKAFGHGHRKFGRGPGTFFKGKGKFGPVVVIK